MKRNKYPPPQDLFDYCCSYREYVMVSTVLSEKLIYLLQIIEQTDRYTRRLRDLASDVRGRSCEYKNSAISTAARDTGLPIDVLLRCTIAYSNLDLHMGSISIERKIEIFNGCMEKELDAKSKLPSNIRLIPSIRTDTKEPLVELEDEQITAELYDYADEIQAWLDIHFADEYDEFADDEKFMEVVQIMADLEFMTMQIEKEFD